MKKKEKACGSGNSDLNRIVAAGTMTAIFLLCLCAGCSRDQRLETPTSLMVPGSGACEQILKALAVAFNDQHPGLNIIIPTSTGTSGGIKAVETQSHALGRVGRPLKTDELKTGLTFLPFAEDAVVFAVGKNVQIDDLTAAQLADIFSGATTDWRQLGGRQAPIRVVARQSDETSLTIIRRGLAAFSGIIICDSAKLAFHDYEMIDLLNKFPTAIGFLTLSSVIVPGNEMRPVGIDGIRPTADNLKSGAYPLKATYGLVYRKEGLNALAAQFIDFIFSQKGNDIIADAGLVTLTRSN